MSLAQTILLLIATSGTAHPCGHFWIAPDSCNSHKTNIREAAADWVFKAYRAKRVVVWSCQPFRKVRTRRQLEDAHLKLDLIKKKGQMRCRIIKPSDESNVDQHKKKASVAATIGGTGVGKLLPKPV